MSRTNKNGPCFTAVCAAGGSAVSTCKVRVSCSFKKAGSYTIKAKYKEFHIRGSPATITAPAGSISPLNSTVIVSRTCSSPTFFFLSRTSISKNMEKACCWTAPPAGSWLWTISVCDMRGTKSVFCPGMCCLWWLRKQNRIRSSWERIPYALKKISIRRRFEFVFLKSGRTRSNYVIHCTAEWIWKLFAECSIFQARGIWRCRYVPRGMFKSM